MAYDEALIRQKLDRWEQYMAGFHLPTWEELPDMDLYMDQVLFLVERYLDLIPHDEKNPVVTASAVNNYVRLKVMPAPIRKRYSRQHLACLIMIVALKQSLTLAEIQSILGEHDSPEAMQHTYNDFVRKMDATTRLFMVQVREAANQLLVPENENGGASLVLTSAVSSMLYKLLTAKLTALQQTEENA